MQQFIKEIICSVSEKGLSNIMTICFMVLSFLPVIVISYKISLTTNIGTIKIASFMASTYIANFVLMLVLAWIETGFEYFGGQNGIRSFAYTPLLCGVFAKIFNISWKQGNAIWAVCLPFSHGIAHIGCVFPGCCQGYPCSWGIYNTFKEQYLFPVQLLESAVAIVIGIYILRRVIQSKYDFDGKEYPIMLVLFGSTRFVCEFFRDNEKILGGCSSLAFHALFMFVVGIVWLLIIRKREKASVSAEMQTQTCAEPVSYTHLTLPTMAVV